MRARAAALPPAFSLLKSEFNDFLFAPVGEEDDHRTLTVLSALSCEGIDPWQQAARLRQLPREAATRNLASILAALTDRPCSETEARLAADRLIALLPRRASRRARFVTVARRMRRAVARLVSR
jgi:hypothetical protein